MSEFGHIVLSQDFFPAVGGAHLWLYEVYKRWPEPVKAIVSDYTPEPVLAERQTSFDQLDHGHLSITRHQYIFTDLNLFGLSFYQKTRQIHKLINMHCSPRNVTIHCLRAYPEGFVAALYKRLHGNKPKLVIYAHGEEVVTAHTSRQLGWMAKLAYKSADCIIANSLSTQNLINDFCTHPNVNIIHPGVDIQSFGCNEAEVKAQRQKWGFSENEIVLVAISRMEPRKNHARVLRAIAELRMQGIPVVSVMASSGDEKPKLQQLARDLGIVDVVRFPGYIEDRERVLSFAAADIHVQPSVQEGSMIEGYGIVFIEAAAAGTPSISGNVGGQAESVLDGKTGIVVDGTDQSKLTESIKNLAENNVLRLRMGRAGKAWAQKNDWSEISNKTLTIINGVGQTC